MEGNFLNSTLNQGDVIFELPLRPPSLKDFVGQRLVCERLDLSLQAAKERSEPLGHCLFCGPPGLGKTTLAHILANAMGTQLHISSGPCLEKAGDLAGLLTNLQAGDILFIDEVHRLSKNIEEYLYSAMEDFCIDLVIDSGANARSVQLKLKPFTLVGATTRMGLLAGPFRSRFPLIYRLDYYGLDELTTIVQRSGRILNFDVDEPGAREVARRSRGTPRIANNLLRWVRDYAQMRAGNRMTAPVVEDALTMLAIDHEGLEEIDKKILETIIEHYGGGPVGLNTIAVALSEDKNTLEEVYEPYLIMKGFLKRTPRGREVTKKAYEHMGKPIPQKMEQGGFYELF